MENKNWSACLQDSVIDHDSIENNISFVKHLSELNNCKIYDVITLWHSLEHIHNIENLFGNINRLIKDRGTLLIAVPNLNAPERLFYKQNWAPYDAPRHLYHFNQETVTKLLALYGFSIVKTYSMIQDTFFNILLSKNLNIFKKIYVLLKSLIVISFNRKKSSSLLYVCKRKY